MPVPLIAASSAATAAFRPVSGLVSGIGRRLGIGRATTPIRQRIENSLDNLASAGRYDTIAVVASGGTVPVGDAEFRRLTGWNYPINFSDGNVREEHPYAISYAQSLMGARAGITGPVAPTARGAAGSASSAAGGPASEPATAQAGGVPWGPIALIGGGLAVAYFAFKGR